MWHVDKLAWVNLIAHICVHDSEYANYPIKNLAVMDFCVKLF